MKQNKQFQGSKRKGREAAWQKRQAEKAKEQRLLKIINSRRAALKKLLVQWGLASNKTHVGRRLK